MKKYFTFEIHVLDDKNIRRRFRASNFQVLKLLDWGEDDMSTATETAALRVSFKQEVSVLHKLDHPNVTRVNT
ncbi:cilia- and flagella-associated protein 20 [Phtheirospermum japonicum]|uniref:Cilia-and flagella-associated protein 20 n=1 Tax=Phtheirospermum japonicum TaxID=374723 RepID=A0A830DC91_9LAMI|nr:cilia- and flagella-associated protein 20 [Phtheirospermum japonicum]